MSNSMRPHRWQPASLLCPWESPGKNTGVGCHFLLQCMRAKSLQAFPTLCDRVDSSPPGSSVHRIFQAGMLEWAAIPFSRGIFLTQGSNPGWLHCRQILYCLNHHGSPEASKRNQIKPTWSEYSLGKINAKRNGRRGKNQARVKSLDFILIIDFYSVSDMICLQKRRRYVLIWRHSNIQKLCREDRTGKETEKIQLVTQSVVYWTWIEETVLRRSGGGSSELCYCCWKVQ